MSVERVEHLEKVVTEHDRLLVAIQSDVHATSKAVEKISASIEKMAEIQHDMKSQSKMFTQLLQTNADNDRRSNQFLEERMNESCKFMHEKVDNLNKSMTERVETLHLAKEKRIEALEKKGWWIVSLVLGAVVLGALDLLLGHSSFQHI